MTRYNWTSWWWTICRAQLVYPLYTWICFGIKYIQEFLWQQHQSRRNRLCPITVKNSGIGRMKIQRLVATSSSSPPVVRIMLYCRDCRHAWGRPSWLRMYPDIVVYHQSGELFGESLICWHWWIFHLRSQTLHLEAKPTFILPLSDDSVIIIRRKISGL